VGKEGRCNYVMAPSSVLEVLLHLGYVPLSVCMCVCASVCARRSLHPHGNSSSRSEGAGEHQQDKTIISLLHWHILRNMFLTVLLVVYLC